MKTMKILTGVFGASIVGIALCLVMTVYTGVREYQEQHKPVAPHYIPTPAAAP
jgi:hypothetical protein